MATLQRILKELRKEKKRAQKEVARLEEAISAFGRIVGKRAVKARRKMSAAARKRISRAQKMRWAKWKRDAVKKLR